jgi:Sec-independent protein translocase protein TatA
MSIGGSEFLIIAVVALLLFGPSLLAFWFGYVLGQKKRDEDAASSAETPAETPAETSAGQPPAQPPATPGPLSDEQSPSADSPAIVGNDGGNEAE